MIATHIAREQITVSNSAKTLTAATVTGRVIYAEIQVLGQQVRTTYDGDTAPVAATTGQLWNPGQVWRVWGVHNLKNLQFIREPNSDATLIVNYWGSAV